MRKKLIFLLVVTMTFVACASKEESARKMYNKAITLQQNKQFDEAGKIFQEIVSKYPETETAIEVNKEMLVARRAQEILKESTQETIKEMLGQSLDAFRLDNKRYPTTEEGLEILVANKTHLSTWDGPYLKFPKYINDVTYKRDGEEYILTSK